MTSDMPSNTLHKDKGCVRYDVVPGPDGMWVVRRDGCTLARRSTRAAATMLATHMAWREASHDDVRTIVRCESHVALPVAADDEPVR